MEKRIWYYRTIINMRKNKELIKRIENMSDICVEIADYKTILSHSGKIDGIIGSCIIDNLTNIVNDNLKSLYQKQKAF